MPGWLMERSVLVYVYGALQEHATWEKSQFGFPSFARPSLPHPSSLERLILSLPVIV